MPLYRYECEACGECEEFSSVKERHNQRCACGRPLTLIPVAGQFIPRTEPHFDPGLGCRVEGYADRKRKMRERGLEEVGDIRHVDDLPLRRDPKIRHNEDEWERVWRENT